MQGKVRVLIVDDAVVVRRMLADILDSDPELEVVGTAANGKAALEKMPQVEPQVETQVEPQGETQVENEVGNALRTPLNLPTKILRDSWIFGNSQSFAKTNRRSSKRS